MQHATSKMSPGTDTRSVSNGSPPTRECAHGGERAGGRARGWEDGGTVIGMNMGLGVEQARSGSCEGDRRRSEDGLRARLRHGARAMGCCGSCKVA